MKRTPYLCLYHIRGPPFKLKIAFRPNSLEGQGEHAHGVLPRFLLAQRAVTAFLALSLRCSGVIPAALAGPPFLPPFFPSFEKYARRSGGRRLDATIPVYVIRSRKARKKRLTFVSRSRIIQP